MAAITIADYKTWAGITGTTYDAVLTVIIAQAQAMAERYTGRNFESAARTERYDGPQDSNTIQLKSWPVASITSVKFYTSPTAYTTLSSGTYTVDTDTGILYLPGTGVPEVYATRDIEGYPQSPDIGTSPSFSVGTFAYAVAYTGGYSVIPDDLKYALYRITDFIYKNRGDDPGLKSESIMNYSYTRDASGQDAMAITRSLFANFVGGVL